MTGPGARLLDLFLAPAAEAPAPTAHAAVAYLPRMTLVSSAAEARVLAPALVLALARSCGARAGLAAVWGAAAPGGGLALPAARRLAKRLTARGLEAVALGGVAWVALPSDPAEARALAAHAAAGAEAADAPSLIVLAGPRSQVLDPVVSESDLVVVAAPADAPPSLVALAEQSLAAGGARTASCTPPHRPLARALAAAGLAVPAELAACVNRLAEMATAASQPAGHFSRP